MTKKHTNRYAVPEDENFEPDADEAVLKNFLGIKSKHEMEAIEEQELQRTELELLADLMAIQANKPPINYSAIDQTQNPNGFSHYILSIHAGLEENYSPIQKIFKVLIEQSI